MHLQSRHLAAILGLSACLLPASLSAQQSAIQPAALFSKKSAPVLMIGDSLSVGPFGEAVQTELQRRYGESKFAFYASCGSSPEHWLRDEPDYITKCGFREANPYDPSRTRVIDYHNGIPPQRVITPKIEKLLAYYRPEIVIVQLGTNWFDDLVPGKAETERPKKVEYLDRFIAALRGDPRATRRIIWITPPDSSRFSPAIENDVQALIRDASRKYTFQIIDSTKMTKYTKKTGSDGVHYNGEDARKWAAAVLDKLPGKLR